jgi:Late exocytosis, associated with Golgi transport/Calcium-dependent channel, 7TM region, putative phosphate/Cytosolic domain of 10TM putative phosphate transporter
MSALRKSTCALSMICTAFSRMAKVEAVASDKVMETELPELRLLHRILQENLTDDAGQLNEAQDWSVLRTTLLLYLPTFVLIVLLFCFLRRRHPAVYNVRNSVTRLHSPLAEKAYGYLEWTWKIMSISEDDIFQHCGMDAVCLLRILRLGLRLSCAGVFCSIFLIPVYVTASTDDGTTDKYVQTTTTNIPEGSHRFTATVLAAYIIFGYTMYSVVTEFQWFTVTREKFLTAKVVRNYTVYVSGIPRQYRSNTALARFFQKVISVESVFSAAVALDIPKLTAAINRQEYLQLQLERAQILHALKSTASPTEIIEHRREIIHYQDQLKIVQDEIRDLRALIEERRDAAITETDVPQQHVSSSIVASSLLVGSVKRSGNSPNNENTLALDDEKKTATSAKKDLGSQAGTRDPQGSFARDRKGRSLAVNVRRSTRILESGEDEESLGLSDSESHGCKSESQSSDRTEFVTVASRGLREIGELVAKAVGLGADDEGKPLDAGFVTFTKLSAVTVALQVVHSQKPFQMDVVEAPAPGEVLWKNVGLQHKSLQMGKLLAFAFTTALCIFWTVPVTFLVSLTEVNALQTKMPFLQDWLEAAPWLEPLLNQIAPLLLSFLDAVILPLLLTETSKLAGVLGMSHLEASLFVKLAAFHVSVNMTSLQYSSIDPLSSRPARSSCFSRSSKLLLWRPLQAPSHPRLRSLTIQAILFGILLAPCLLSRYFSHNSS